MTGRNAQGDPSCCCLLQRQIVMNTAHQGIAIQRLLDSTNARLNHVKVSPVVLRALRVTARDVTRGSPTQPSNLSQA